MNALLDLPATAFDRGTAAQALRASAAPAPARDRIAGARRSPFSAHVAAVAALLLAFHAAGTTPAPQTMMVQMETPQEKQADLAPPRRLHARRTMVTAPQPRVDHPPNPRDQRAAPPVAGRRAAAPSPRRWRTRRARPRELSRPLAGPAQPLQALSARGAHGAYRRRGDAAFRDRRSGHVLSAEIRKARAVPRWTVKRWR